MSHPRTLRSKLTLFISVGIASAGVLLIVVVFLITRDALLRERQANLQSLNNAYAEEIAQHFSFARIEARKLASRGEVIAASTQADAAAQDLQVVALLREYGRLSDYRTFFVADREGKISHTTDDASVGMDVSLYRFFQQALQGKESLQFVMGIHPDRGGFYVASPVYAGNRVVGVAVVEIDPAQVYELLQKNGRASDGSAMLVDQDGVVLFSHDGSKVYKTLTTLPESTWQRLKVEGGFMNASLEPLTYGFLQEAISRQSSGMITASDEYDDESELLVFSKIADDSFVLIDEFDTHSLLVPIYRDMVLVGLILLAILFFLGVWVSSLIRRNLRPLEDFRRVVLSMREKDFSQRVVFHTGDEIEELGTAFNVMAEELGEFYQSMDIKVGEKTKELAKFRLAVEHASDHIVITDTDGIILYANPAVTRITGFTREEILGKKAGSKDLWGGMMSQEFYDQMWQAIKIKQQVFSGEITNRRKGGELYQAIASIAPVVEGGQLLFFIGIERDITHEKQVDRAKTEFVSLASHQLRTPLTAINWYAEMLLDESGEHCSPEQREQMETILKSSQRMAELVDTLLNVSRLELGTFIIEPKPTDVVAILEEVLEELRVRIVEKRLEIIKDIDPEQIQGNMDTKLLRIIFQNLLSNAVKYTPEGGKVVVILKQTSTEYLLQVVDTGMGIPKCAQNQIFKKLFRADNVKQREVEGTGLGLYITKTIVETAGGTIGFHSVENEGTTFEVIFPPIGMLSKEGTKPLT